MVLISEVGMVFDLTVDLVIELRPKKTGYLHMPKQRSRSASR